MTGNGRTLRGFTLVEVLAAVIVLSIVAAVVLPVVFTSTTRLASAEEDRRAAESVAYAMDRVVRLLREVPLNADRAFELASAASDSVELLDGRRVRLHGTDLLYRDADGNEALLCAGVSAFQIEYLAPDGRTSLLAADADQTWLFRVGLTAEGVELRAAVFPRVRAGT